MCTNLVQNGQQTRIGFELFFKFYDAQAQARTHTHTCFRWEVRNRMYMQRMVKRKRCIQCVCVCLFIVSPVIQFGCVALRQACSPFLLSFFLQSSIWSSFYIFVRILEPACYSNALLFACWRGKMPFIRKMLSAVVILFFLLLLSLLLLFASLQQPTSHGSLRIG